MVRLTLGVLWQGQVTRQLLWGSTGSTWWEAFVRRTRFAIRSSTAAAAG